MLMRSALLPLLCLLLISSAALANDDSIGVKSINGSFFILHKVEAGQGLYSISKRYNVSLSAIAAANPGSDKQLHKDEILFIPAPAGARLPAYYTKGNVVQPTLITRTVADTHVVVQGETLFRIATNYSVSVQDIRKWNKLTNNNLNVGDKLIVGYRSEKVASTVDITEAAYTDTTKHFIASAYQKEYLEYMNQLKAHKANGNVSYDEVKAYGTCTWIDDGSIRSRRSLALHADAPPGTIVKITNPSNGQYVYVKVVASINKANELRNPDVKVTKAAAEQIGANDKFFRVEMHYMKPQL